MSCCNKRRQDIRQPVTPKRSHLRSTSLQNADSDQFIYFQYFGRKGGLAITGPITGRRYRFDRYGAIVVVDLKDRDYLVADRNLRQVSTS